MVHRSPAASVGTAADGHGCGRQPREGLLDLVVVDAGADGRPSWAASPGMIPLLASMLQQGSRIAFIGVARSGGWRVTPLQRPLIGREDGSLIDTTRTVPADDVEPRYSYALRWAVDLLSQGDAAYATQPYRADGRSPAVLVLGDAQLAADAAGAAEVHELLEQRCWPVYTIGIAERAPDGAGLGEKAGATGARSFMAATAAELAAACVAVVADLACAGRTGDGLPAGRGGIDGGRE